MPTRWFIKMHSSRSSEQRKKIRLSITLAYGYHNARTSSVLFVSLFCHSMKSRVLNSQTFALSLSIIERPWGFIGTSDQIQSPFSFGLKHSTFSGHDNKPSLGTVGANLLFCQFVQATNVCCEAKANIIFSSSGVYCLYKQYMLICQPLVATK